MQQWSSDQLVLERAKIVAEHLWAQMLFFKLTVLLVTQRKVVSQRETLVIQDKVNILEYKTD